jgi:hypothetical protein
VAWVAWRNICTPNTSGGLGFRDLELENLSLLGKWKWRWLNEKQDLLGKVLNSRYGGWSNLGMEAKAEYKSASLWWRDLYTIDIRQDNLKGWFWGGINKKIKNGLDTSFWEDSWLGNSSLKDLYCRPYYVVLNKFSSVGEIALRRGSNWEWGFVWRRELFEWEMSDLNNLKNTIMSSLVLEDFQDAWRWREDLARGYSAASTYKYMINKRWETEVSFQGEELEFVKFLWKSQAPFRVKILVWQLLLDRLPTKANLSKRNIIPIQEEGCMFSKKIVIRLITFSFLVSKAIESGQGLSIG